MVSQINTGNEEEHQTQRLADEVDWNAPIMSSVERAKNFFKDLEEKFQTFLHEIEDFKTKLIEEGIWDDFLDLVNVSTESSGISREPKGNLYLAWETAKINECYTAVQQKKELYDLKIQYLTENKIPPEEGNRQLEAGEYRDMLMAHRLLNIISSPYFRYLLSNIDNITIKELMEQMKHSYRVLTFDDHVETVEKLIEENENDGALIILKDQTKHENDHPDGTESVHYTSSDEFMMDMVSKLAESKKIKVVQLRGIPGFVNFIVEYKKKNPDLSYSQVVDRLREKKLKIGMIDDAMYSGTQKSGVFTDHGSDIEHYASHKIWDSEKNKYYQPINLTEDEIVKINQLLNDSLRLYVVGSTYHALTRVAQEDHRSKIYVHRFIPTLEGIVKEPYLSFLGHVLYVFGDLTYKGKPTYGGRNVQNQDDAIKEVMQNLKKPLLVTPFKVPDWISMVQLWYLSEKGNSLYSLPESGQAYIDANNFF